jgi:Holliday junction DNA helicase RuvB
MLNFSELLQNALEEEINNTNDIFAPKTFDEFVGQDEAKDILRITVEAAKKESRSLPNILLAGPPGVGKTTLASLVFKLYGRNPKILDGLSVNKNMPESGAIIIDEIHNIDPQVCDTLNIFIDRGKLHIIGATTNPGKLPAAFRSRFRVINLRDYNVTEIISILEQVIRKKEFRCNKEAIKFIASRSRNNPRTGIKYLKFIFDYMVVSNKEVLTLDLIEKCFTKLGIDSLGLSNLDRLYLGCLQKDKPVGLQYLSAKSSIDETTILQEVEPYLLKLGLIDRTNKGRVPIA